MSYRLSCVALLVGLVASGCSNSSTAPTPVVQPKFTAALTQANEFPPISNADGSGSGTATLTLKVTRDAAINITAATADFVVTLAGFPAGTTLSGAHIHPGVSGTSGGVAINTGLVSGEVVLAGGSGGFTKSGISVDPVLAQQIINTPAGFYFNLHTTLSPGGAIRGQLVLSN